MCGRFALFSKVDVIRQYADLIDANIEWSPHYNISPGMMLPVLIAKNQTPVIALQKWGFVPDFAYGRGKEMKIFSPINVKSETINDKPMFRNSFKNRRCLIPANGFYEWRKSDRQPFFITVKKMQLLFLAGIWNTGKRITPTIPDNFAIITTKANEKLIPIHQRMPVIINPEKIEDWLLGNKQDKLVKMLAPFPEEEIDIRPVTRKVNFSKINHAGLIENTS